MRKDMNLQAHKLSLIGALLDVDDAKMLSRVETFLKAELAAKREKEIVPMTMEEYRAEIELSLQAAREGRYITQEELEREVRSW